MPRSSSIFSFDTLTGVPRPGRSFWLTVGLCAGLRLLLFATADRLEQIPAPGSHQRLLYIEQTLVRANPTPPKVLLMGSSLMRYGLVEDEVAAAAGVRPEEVVNLGVENGSAWDALVLLRRNPRLADSVRLIVYAIHPGEINASSRGRWIDNFYQFSTLREKFMADRWSDRAKLTLDAVWPFKSQRRDLVTWLDGLRGRGACPDLDGLRPAWHSPLFERLKARSSVYLRPPAVEDLAGIDGQVSPQHLRHLHEFVAFCQEQRIVLHLLTTPTRRIYDEVVAANDSLRAGMSRFEQLLGSLGVGTSLFHKPPQRNCLALDETADFLDYCHLTPDGARKFTHAVMADLGERGILPLQSTAALTAATSTRLGLNVTPTP